MRPTHSRASLFLGKIIALLVLGVTAEAFAQKAAPPTPRKPGYERFTMVRTRNIFDPDRQGNTPITSAKTAPPTAADYAALTGILIRTGKSLAFFSGSRPEFNKVLQVSGEIAGATLTQITPNAIVIERAGKSTTVAVGQTVPLDSTAAPTAAPVTTAVSTSTSPSTSSTDPLSASKEAIIRRMMEKRQQETK